MRRMFSKSNFVERSDNLKVLNISASPMETHFLSCVWGRRIYAGHIAIYVSRISLLVSHHPHWAPQVTHREIIVTPTEREVSNSDEPLSFYSSSFFTTRSVQALSFRDKVIILSSFLWCFSTMFLSFMAAVTGSSGGPRRISTSLLTEGVQYAEKCHLCNNQNLRKVFCYSDITTSHLLALSSSSFSLKGRKAVDFLNMILCGDFEILLKNVHLFDLGDKHAIF